MVNINLGRRVAFLSLRITVPFSPFSPVAARRLHPCVQDALEGFTPLHWAVLSDNPKAFDKIQSATLVLAHASLHMWGTEGRDLAAEEWSRQRRQRCTGKDG